MKLLGRFLLLLLFFGCKKDSLKAPDAFYLKTGTANVVTTAPQGSSSSKITDLWLYVNGIFRGCYPVGNTLPIVSYGPTEIRLYPGIKNNGISTTRVPYEFYEPLAIDTAVNTSEIISRDLSFKYRSNTKFHVIEACETGTSGISIKKSNNSDTNFVLTGTAEAFEGLHSLYFALDANRKTAQFQSNTYAYPLPASGAPVYMELNFRCNHPFDVGVYSGNEFRYCATVNASPNWNKIYVSLISAVSTNPYPTYGFYIKAVKRDDIDNPYFYIDNIKLISY